MKMCCVLSVCCVLCLLCVLCVLSVPCLLCVCVCVCVCCVSRNCFSIETMLERCCYRWFPSQRAWVPLVSKSNSMGAAGIQAE
jgi:hypothetical protein